MLDIGLGFAGASVRLGRFEPACRHTQVRQRQRQENVLGGEERNEQDLMKTAKQTRTLMVERSATGALRETQNRELTLVNQGQAPRLLNVLTEIPHLPESIDSSLHSALILNQI